jgi:hypothetical protein
MNSSLIVILIALLLHQTAVFVDCFRVDAWLAQRYQENTGGTRISYLRGYLLLADTDDGGAVCSPILVEGDTLGHSLTRFNGHAHSYWPLDP